jgi:hypothetical protein
VGDTNARGFTVGATFTLVDHPRESENQEYLVTSARVQLKGQEGRGATDDEDPSRTTFVCIDAKVTFRPPRVTPKPIMRGPQTAVVVGPDGQEIWTDQYGRVKGQFHWDRLGESDENSSCWIRVGQQWAGGGFGAQFIPRIGHEVIVDFLEGDPDKPIVTGSVYNGSNMPPFGLPAVGSGDAARSAVIHVEGKGRAYASKTFEVEALTGFTLVCGDSQIAITPSGITLISPNITLSSKEVDVVADTLKATITNALTMGASTVTIQTSGAKVALDSSSASVTGSSVKLGSGSGASSQAQSQPVKVTHVQMKDSQGKPRANARVLLIKGDEQRITVLDANGLLELIGDDSYQVSFPDDAKAKS